MRVKKQKNKKTKKKRMSEKVCEYEIGVANGGLLWNLIHNEKW